MSGKIVINTERCKGCGLCVTVCPRHGIVIASASNKSGYFPAEKTDGECTGCAMCAIICPEAIIEVYRNDADIIEIDAKPSKKLVSNSAEGKVQSKSCKSGTPK